ncbi:MAG: ABC transporter ATP-binding protein [Actinomycetes bacterium]
MRVRDVTVAYGEVTIVDGVDLDVADGEWLGLLGPNGAGKTTLLRTVAGLVRRTTGEVTVDGIDPSTVSRREVARHVAFVDQRPVLPPGMTVGEYVLLGRTAHVPLLGFEREEDLAVCEQAMDRLDVRRFVDRDVLTLSGGEAQRVVLARALAQQAQVLLLDEPTSALDLGHQQHVLQLVDELRHERGLTVVATMHDLTVAGQFAHRCALLAGGRLVATGPVAEVLTAETIAEHYGARVQVLDDGCGGVIVVPLRTHVPGLTPPPAGWPTSSAGGTAHG